MIHSVEMQDLDLQSGISKALNLLRDENTAAGVGRARVHVGDDEYSQALIQRFASKNELER
jgi:hypothetical protein